MVRWKLHDASICCRRLTTSSVMLVVGGGGGGRERGDYSQNRLLYLSDGVLLLWGCCEEEEEQGGVELCDVRYNPFVGIFWVIRGGGGGSFLRAVECDNIVGEREKRGFRRAWSRRQGIRVLFGSSFNNSIKRNNAQKRSIQKPLRLHIFFCSFCVFLLNCCLVYEYYVCR